MFDFDEIEVPEDAGTEEAEQEAPEEIAQRAAGGLERGEWKVRWDSCRELAKLGHAAAPYVHLLEDLAEREKDGDVRKAAVSALEALREAGVQGSAAADDTAEAERAAAGLDDQSFSVRRNACRTLGRLGALAAPYFSALQRLAEGEKDYEVRQAARDAVRKLRSAGVRLEVERGDEGAAGAGGTGGAEALDWWPKVLFQIFGETLPMRLEREDMMPAELTELWEKCWGVQYASRVRFAAPEDSDARWLRPKGDFVPRTPFLVQLEANNGTVLQTLASALKLYGRMTPEEVAEDRRSKLEEQMQAAERRAVADAKEDAKYLSMDHRRRWRQVEEVSKDAPTTKRVLGRSKLGCG